MLLVAADGHFDENSSFGLTDWLAHTPREVLARNFEVPESAFVNVPDHELYIFHAPVPGPLSAERIAGAGPAPEPFTHHLLAQEPVRTRGGSFRIADSRVFQASKTISFASQTPTTLAEGPRIPPFIPPTSLSFFVIGRTVVGGRERKMSGGTATALCWQGAVGSLNRRNVRALCSSRERPKRYRRHQTRGPMKAGAPARDTSLTR
jgi:hypothetical protein